MLATGRCQSSFNLAVNLIKSFLLVGEKKVQHKQFPCSFSALVAFAASFPSPNSAVKSEVLKAEALKGYVYSSVSSCVWNIRLGIKKKLSHVRINARTKGKNENLWKRNQNSLVILSCIFIAKKMHSFIPFLVSGIESRPEVLQQQWLFFYVTNGSYDMHVVNARFYIAICSV